MPKFSRKTESEILKRFKFIETVEIQPGKKLVVAFDKSVIQKTLQYIEEIVFQRGIVRDLKIDSPEVVGLATMRARAAKRKMTMQDRIEALSRLRPIHTDALEEAERDALFIAMMDTKSDLIVLDETGSGLQIRLNDDFSNFTVAPNYWDDDEDDSGLNSVLVRAGAAAPNRPKASPENPADVRLALCEAVLEGATADAQEKLTQLYARARIAWEYKDWSGDAEALDRFHDLLDESLYVTVGGDDNPFERTDANSGVGAGTADTESAEG